MLLDSNQLADMRSCVNSSLTDTCELLSPVMASDGQGGQTTNWAVAGSTICRVLADQVEAEVVDGGKATAVALFRIYLPWDTTLDASMRIQVSSGVVYEVIGRSPRSSQVQLVARASLVE